MTAAAQPPPRFTCPDCGARSWNPFDAVHGYCGRCHAYTGDPTWRALQATLQEITPHQ